MNDAHEGDPCVYCGVAHDHVPPGPCRSRDLIGKLYKATKRVEELEECESNFLSAVKERETLQARIMELEGINRRMYRVYEKDNSCLQAQIKAAVKEAKRTLLYLPLEPYQMDRVIKILASETEKGCQECATCDGEGINIEGYCPQGNFTEDGKCLTPSERKGVDEKQIRS